MPFFTDIDPNDGACRICGNTYTYNGITRHLGNCAADHAGDEAPQRIHLRFKSFTTTSKPYWLHLMANPEAPLRALDEHLRNIWFFGADHPSRLAIRNQSYTRRPTPDASPPDSSDGMTEPMKDVLIPTPEFSYYYEVGQGRLMLIGKVYEPLPLPEPLSQNAPDADVHTLARNERVTYDCGECGHDDATHRCFDCIDVFTRGFLCDDCADDHPDDHGLLEFGNSPLAVPMG